MRLTIEIAAAAFLVMCLSASSAAFAAQRADLIADDLNCAFGLSQNASPAQRCAAIEGLCGGKFRADDCGEKSLADM
jgi:hypothetical protein